MSLRISIPRSYLSSTSARNFLAISRSSFAANCKRLYSTIDEQPVKVQYLSIDTPEFKNASFSDTPSGANIAVVTLDRPKAKNSISLRLLDQLFEAAHRDYISQSTRALILRSSTADIFCAGADLKERKTFTPTDTRNFLKKLNYTLDLFEAQPIPTISAISGLALGGGLELALSTDFRVLGENAAVGLTESRLAIIPGAGGTYRLPKLIGQAKALDMILTGRRVKPEEALQLGVASRAVKDADEGALALAREISAGGPLAIIAAKKAVKGGSRQWEEAMYERVVNSEDKFEALAAFAEKRKPVFKGK